MRCFTKRAACSAGSACGVQLDEEMSDVYMIDDNADRSCFLQHYSWLDLRACTKNMSETTSRCDTQQRRGIRKTRLDSFHKRARTAALVSVCHSRTSKAIAHATALAHMTMSREHSSSTMLHGSRF